MGGGGVEFYGQGGTSTNSSSITVPAGSSAIPVYDVGDILVGSVLQAGLNGPTLSVTAISGATLTVNNAGSSFSLGARTRLILLTNRPTVYADPIGLVRLNLSSNVIADASGRISCYLSRSRFDYIVLGNSSASVTIDSSSNAGIAAGNTVTWQHTAAGDYRIAVVGISWIGETGGEAISSVTCASLPMTLLGSSSNVDLYYLLNPPAGTLDFTVTFGPGEVVDAVVGAVTAKSLNLASTLTGISSTGSGASASLSFPSSATTSRLLGVLGIDNPTSAVTVAMGTGQTAHWNTSAGSSPGVTNGAASSKPGTGGATTLSNSWSSTRTWGLVGVELPFIGATLASRLYPDAVGALFNPSRLDARDFISIQAAIDALPSAGGVVHVPGDLYTITSTLFIPKNKRVHLIGDGLDRTIIHCTNKNADVLWIKSSNTTIENLTIRGAGLVVPDLPNREKKGRGIVIGALSADDPTDILRHIAIIGCKVELTPSYSLYVYGQDDPDAVSEKTLLIWGHYSRSEFMNNNIGGMVYLGSVSNSHLFQDCAFTSFRGIALNAFDASAITISNCDFEDRMETPTTPGLVMPYVALDQCKNVLITNSWFENHQPEDTEQYYILIGVGAGGACQDVTVHGCRFVRNKGTLPRMVWVQKNSKSIAIVNPTCYVTGQVPDARPLGSEDILVADSVSDSPEVYVSGGILASESILTKAAMVMSNARGLTVVATGPRVTPPRITETQRDNANSLARVKRPGDTIYNSDLGRLQTWTGSDWVPVRKTAGGTAGQSGPLLSAGGSYHVSAYVTLSSTTAGSVSVVVSWMEELVQRNVTVVPTFSTAGGATNGVAYIVAAGPVTYTVNATGFLVGSYSASIRAEAV